MAIKTGADEHSGASREVLILGLDAFAKKNVTQIRAMEGEGYSFTIVANDLRGDSRAMFDSQGFERSRLILPQGALGKLATAWKLLRRGRYRHVELYPAGRLALFYVAMLKLLRHKIVVVERGDIDILGLYGAIVRAAIRLAYRFADLIIYKEVYMAQALRRFTSKPLAFVPNCIGERPIDRRGSRGIDFLWVNRTIPQRRPEWVARAMSDARLADRSLVMLGLEGRATLEPYIAEQQHRLREQAGPNCRLEGFLDPEPFYPQARFFCLPSTIVFGNNALLEAMASGVVPVVTESQGVELIVEDGVSGIVTSFDAQAYCEGMVRAASLSTDEWEAMSRKAVETVREKYSVEAWTRTMADVYARLGAA